MELQRKYYMRLTSYEIDSIKKAFFKTSKEKIEWV
ncbi:MAG: hypothetical protein QG565_329 [Campylobacterota bacterium]|nr:hypothetical protein [Campylobacterota bacterium]